MIKTKKSDVEIKLLTQADKNPEDAPVSYKPVEPLDGDANSDSEVKPQTDYLKGE